MSFAAEVDVTGEANGWMPSRVGLTDTVCRVMLPMRICCRDTSSIPDNFHL
jgi:hypothetical protein